MTRESEQSEEPEEPAQTSDLATRHVTVTLHEGELGRIRSLIKSGSVASVSSFVQAAVSSALDADTIWEQTLAELLDQTGGPVTASEAEMVERALTGSGTNGDGNE